MCERGRLVARARGKNKSSNHEEESPPAPTPVELRDYQEEARAAVIQAWEQEEKRRMLLVLPTGCVPGGFAHHELLLSSVYISDVS